MREAPKAVTGTNNSKAAAETKAKAVKKHRAGHRSNNAEPDYKDHSKDAERRMQEVVRLQGRLTKQGGVMKSSGTSEFQIASGYNLEKMVNG